MSIARVHIRNLVANWVGQGANLLAIFFLSPFVVHTLGSVEYGLWTLLAVLTGYMGLFDLGVRASTGRYIIFHFGRGDHARLDGTIRTGLGFFSAGSALILLVSLVIGWGFPYFFPSAPPEYHGTVCILLLLLAVNIWFSIIGAVFGSVLAAHDRIDLGAATGLVSLAVRVGGTLLALIWGYGLVGLTVVTLLSTVVGTAGNWWLAYRVYPQMRVWPLMLSRERLKELLGYGLAAFVSRVSTSLIGQTQMIVVGAFVAVASVTTYSVGAMLVFYSWTFIDLIGGSLFPSVQRAAAVGDVESERWYYLRQVRLALVFGLPIFMGYMVFGQMFIGLWMGGGDFDEAAVRQSAIVMALLSASRFFGLVSIGSSPALYARGRIWLDTVLTVIEAATNLGLSILLALTGWGIYGVAVAALVSMALLRGVVMPWTANRVLGLASSRMLKVATSGLLCAGSFRAWCVLIQRVIPGSGWGAFALEVGLALVGYAPLALVFLVSRSDRQRLVQYVRTLV